MFQFVKKILDGYARGVLEANSTRDERQARVDQWVRETFGTSTNVRERTLRLLEEAVELAQAEGIRGFEVDELVVHVYRKPVGEAPREVGGVGLTLLAYCAAKGFSADALEREELRRVLGLPRSLFRARQAIKAEAGVGAPCDPDEPADPATQDETPRGRRE